MRRIAHALVAGAIFGSGLAVSGMTNPQKVLNFLDVAGDWDPSLALVMGAALAVATPGFAWLRRRGCTLDGGALPAQPGKRIDIRLLIGSALFGLGWGLAGYCPGPALANLGAGGADAIVFVVAMLTGSQLARFLFPTEKRP